jgi:hypothetical protein
MAAQITAKYPAVVLGENKLAAHIAKRDVLLVNGGAISQLWGAAVCA